MDMEPQSLSANGNDADGNVWCDGFQFAGRRRLSASEAAELGRRVSSGCVLYGWGLWLGRVCLWTSAATFAGFIALQVKFGDRYPLIIGVSLGLPILLPGLAGSMQEIIAGYRWRYRLLFGAALLAVMAGQVLYSRAGENLWSGWLFGIGGMVVIAGGWAALLLRWSDAKGIWPALTLARKDVKTGETLDFVRVSISGKELHIEVLPFSNFIYSADGKLVAEWEVHRVVEVAGKPVDEPEAPWHEMPEPSMDGSYFQRHLSEEEVLELKKLAGKMLKKAAGAVAAVVWTALMVFRLGENVVNRRLDPGLSPYGWSCAALVGVWFLWKKLRERGHLLQDINSGLMVKLKAKDGSIVEFLPLSRILWRTDDRPASWRTSWW